VKNVWGFCEPGLNPVGTPTLVEPTAGPIYHPRVSPRAFRSTISIHQHIRHPWYGSPHTYTTIHFMNELSTHPSSSSTRVIISRPDETSLSTDTRRDPPSDIQIQRAVRREYVLRTSTPGTSGWLEAYRQSSRANFGPSAIQTLVERFPNFPPREISHRLISETVRDPTNRGYIQYWVLSNEEGAISIHIVLFVACTSEHILN
jgi:hypothetical protein